MSTPWARALAVLLTAVGVLILGSAVAFLAVQAPIEATHYVAVVTGPSGSASPAAPTLPPPTPSIAPHAPVLSTMRPGDAGPEILAFQQRLQSLGYWLGKPDGVYGDLTVQAVTAFQKVQDLRRDGIAGRAVGAALENARPTPAETSDDAAISIDKQRQVMFIAHDGKVTWILNVSTGTGKPYQVHGRTEIADTPAGTWQVAWAYDGVKVGELGALYRPRYFHSDGIAVHGYHSVPSYPASHGCVRMSNAAMDWIWAEDLMPVGSSVRVY